MNQEEIKISVIMGVYNQHDRRALRDAVRSVLRQTMEDFEFIIYDDGSEKKAAGYIRELAELDKRIILIGEEENHGLAFSLNSCIGLTKGKYIARMDADDISMPDRFQVQYDFMESHPEYGWCGCNTELFDAQGVWGFRKMPECPEYKDYLKFSPYIHPTVMYRKKIFEENEGYKETEEMLRCEDYEIFMRLSQAGYRGYNIQRCLFRYREDHASYQKRKFKHRVNEARLRYRNFKKMKLLFPVGWMYVLRPIIAGLMPTGIIEWMKRKESGSKR